MPEVRLGLEAVLTIDGAEITNVKDLTVSLEKAEADASTRANNGRNAEGCVHRVHSAEQGWR
jgi:hypothetical protein